MLVKNKTQKTIISLNCKFASSEIDRMLGLLKKSNPRSLLIKTRFGIHTFGLKKAIDVLILDDKHSVQSIKEDLNPNRVFLWNPKHPWVLELPAGTISKSKTRLKDRLEIS